MEDLMDFAIPQRVTKELEQFEIFLRTHLEPQLAAWYKKEAIPRELFQRMGQHGWLGFSQENGHIGERSALRETILMETLAKISPGVAVAILVQNSLGMAPLFLFGSEKQKQNYLPSAISRKRCCQCQNAG
jgi:alkylation response protein AidB-like acyl-CoA dehydrogenase